MYRVGIDIGGTNIVVGVVNDNFDIIAKASCKTNLPRPSEAIISDIVATVYCALDTAQLTMADIETVGVGCPGTCNLKTGVVEYSNNLQFHNLPLRDILQERLGCPTFIENDANAAAFGEYLAGAARGAKSCVCVTLGTGVGSGIIIDGNIYAGENFSGAELGHTVIMVDGEDCSCGRKGCWEAYASATALIQQTRVAMAKHPESIMWKLAGSFDNVNGRVAFDAMRAGDPVGQQVVDTYIRYIACGLVNIINIFQPEVLCVGGGICNERDTLLKPLESYIKNERYSKISPKQTRLCRAQLGNDAGVIGAAALGISR